MLWITLIMPPFITVSGARYFRGLFFCFEEDYPTLALFAGHYGLYILFDPKDYIPDIKFLDPLLLQQLKISHKFYFSTLTVLKMETDGYLFKLSFQY